VEALVLGCGFTGSRVAERLRRRGVRVCCTHRADVDVLEPDYAGKLLERAAPGCLVLHSIPTMPGGRDAAVLEALENRPARVVYLSTTSVYGAAEQVNEQTPAAPDSDRARARLNTENAVHRGPWSSLILRPAAIYGPGRGVHVSMQAGTFKLWNDGANYISRIHVEDLAAIAEAALLSELTGAYPVADDHPCPSREIAEFCSRLLGVPLPPPAERDEIPSTRQSNRRVDGSAIREALGVELRYSSYREGIPASLAL